jgi:quercetin dioxygenase-like cupin family protein
MTNPPEESTYFIRAGQGSTHRIFPGVSINTIAGEGIMLSVVTFEPRSVVEEHAHPHEQMGVMISGTAEFTVGGVTTLIGPGDAWRIPGGVKHKVVALDGPAVALDVFHPVREDYR